MGRGAALLGCALAAALVAPARAQWPWQTGRYFDDAGDSDDDVDFAGLPQGSGFRTEGLTSCDCDLTANACDAFCCCDAACSSFERTTLFDCATAEAVSARPGVRTCADAAAVVSANLPDTSRAAWEADSEDPLARVLCVVADNSASYGDFITPIEPLSTSELDAAVTRNQTFAVALRAGGADGTGRAYYAAGQALNRGTGGGDGASAAEYAPLALPTAQGAGVGAASAACVDFGAIRFLAELQPTPCVTYAPAGGSMADMCVSGGTFDASMYAGLEVGSSGRRPGANGYDRVTVTVRSVTSVTLGGVSRVELPTSPVPVPSIDNSTGACLDALTGAILRFVYSDEGELRSVDAYLTVTDLPAGVTAVERTFGQHWEASDSKDARPRSGRPGYLRGRPLLSGTEENKDQGTVRPSTSGLVGLVTRRADGACAVHAALPVPPAGGLEAHTIHFGEDAMLSCQLPYDLQTLKAKCEAGEQFTLSNLTDGYIGRFGDSYGSNAADWVELAKGSAGDPSWDDDELTCSGLVVGADFEFFHAAFGAAVDLQRQIVGARLSFRTASWRYASAPRQIFTVTASFVDVPTGAAAQFVPPAPGLFAPIPDDAFFPFAVGPTARTSTGGSTGARRRAR